MNIQAIIGKLKGPIRANQSPETLGQMINKLESGAYKTTLMVIVVYIMTGGSFDKLREELPGELVAFIKATMEKIPSYKEYITKKMA